MVTRALACASDFNCQSTCNMLWSLATGGSRPRAALLDALAARFQAVMSGASAQQMGAALDGAPPCKFGVLPTWRHAMQRARSCRAVDR